MVYNEWLVIKALSWGLVYHPWIIFLALKQMIVSSNHNLSDCDNPWPGCCGCMAFNPHPSWGVRCDALLPTPGLAGPMCTMQHNGLTECCDYKPLNKHNL